MARRNIFDNVMRAMEPADESDALPVAKFGAAKSISSSIDELARQAQQLIEGQSVVEIRPDLIDDSFVSDRMAKHDEAFSELLEAIRERGQDSPVLLRPSPERLGRYQIVFGHRRVRVARELGRPVRAVVKTLADIDLVLAQGQENSARSNLSFIERVLFAQRLTELGYAREVIQSALSIDYQTLSKMLTIPKAIPAALIDAIGVARSVGRDRWLEFRKLLERPGQTKRALERISTADFSELKSDERFAELCALVSSKSTPGKVKKAITPRLLERWVAPDKGAAAKISRAGSNLTLVFKSAGHRDFGDYISNRLGELYEQFKAGNNDQKLGD